MHKHQKIQLTITFTPLKPGVTFTVILGIGVNEGIEAARNLLPRCWFDEEKCTKGISALDAYKKEWNDRHGC